MAGALNCRPLDLAVVIRDQTLTHPLTGAAITPVKAGTVVTVISLCGETNWRIEEPIAFTVDMLFLEASLAVWAIDDSELRPIRPQAADGIDEMVKLAGPAPKTLTEVREVQHG